MRGTRGGIDPVIRATFEKTSSDLENQIRKLDELSKQVDKLLSDMNDAIRKRRKKGLGN